VRKMLPRRAKILGHFKLHPSGHLHATIKDYMEEILAVGPKFAYSAGALNRTSKL